MASSIQPQTAIRHHTKTAQTADSAAWVIRHIRQLRKNFRHIRHTQASHRTLHRRRRQNKRIWKNLRRPARSRQHRMEICCLRVRMGDRLDRRVRRLVSPALILFPACIRALHLPTSVPLVSTAHPFMVCQICPQV